MLCRLQRVSLVNQSSKIARRCMAGNGFPASADPLVHVVPQGHFPCGTTYVAPKDPKVVVVPNLVDTLEWVLEAPLNVHQFDEPPIVVEIEHLTNLKHDD